PAQTRCPAWKRNFSLVRGQQARRLRDSLRRALRLRPFGDEGPGGRAHAGTVPELAPGEARGAVTFGNPDRMKHARISQSWLRVSSQNPSSSNAIVSSTWSSARRIFSIHNSEEVNRCPL